MRFFYVAVAETRRDMLEAIINTIKEWNEKLKGRVEAGILVRYTKWRNRECIPCKLAKENNIKVFIDNGAFSFLTAADLEGDPNPFTLAKWRADYAQWLSNNIEMYDFAALPDIPVHGRKFLDQARRWDRIELSIQNQLIFLQSYGRILPTERMVPVIQGYTISEYDYSYNQLYESGILEETAYDYGDYEGILAVGSVCVRKWSANGKTGLLASGKAAGTLNTFLPIFLNECCEEARGFHLFGLHSEATAWFSLHPRFYAADSGAHGLNYRYKWRTVLGCEAPNTPSCAAKAVNHQLRRTLAPLLSESLEAYGVIG